MNRKKLSRCLFLHKSFRKTIQKSSSQQKLFSTTVYPLKHCSLFRWRRWRELFLILVQFWATHSRTDTEVLEHVQRAAEGSTTRVLRRPAEGEKTAEGRHSCSLWLPERSRKGLFPQVKTEQTASSCAKGDFVWRLGLEQVTQGSGGIPISGKI